MENASSEDRLGVDLARAQNQLVRELRARRAALNLSAGEVAARMEVDPSFVSRFERGGTNATFATIRRYAKAVDAMVTYEVCSYQEHKTKVVAQRADAILW
ncbi:helix-turn-helix domain-containing protein, partial [Rhodococcus sp. LB1]|uniref:helix-turn-helix domain-containing protein n=1 Tax=Rhodococcus sp. LB1 TaxID=1807499 RepID=UPI0018D30AF8